MSTSEDMKAAEAAVTKGMSREEVEDLREAFKHFDTNDDGSISRGELAVVLRSLGYSPTLEQLDRLMNKVRAPVFLRLLAMAAPPHGAPPLRGLRREDMEVEVLSDMC